MELPVETYCGRSNAEVSTPRLSSVKVLSHQTLQVFLLALLACFKFGVPCLEMKPCNNISDMHLNLKSL